MEKSTADLGIPEVAESLQQIVDSGGHVWACRTSAVTQHHKRDDLYDDVEAIISAWTSSTSTPAGARRHAAVQEGFQRKVGHRERFRSTARNLPLTVGIHPVIAR
jgi:hypothetical protein